VSANDGFDQILRVPNLAACLSGVCEGRFATFTLCRMTGRITQLDLSVAERCALGVFWEDLQGTGYNTVFGDLARSELRRPVMSGEYCSVQCTSTVIV
jgi:hypothetical protein